MSDVGLLHSCEPAWHKHGKVIPGYQFHREDRENRENDQKKSLSGKTQGIWKFCRNTGKKTQGIWFAQVVNSLILRVKDISIFARKISILGGDLEKSVLCM